MRMVDDMEPPQDYAALRERLAERAPTMPKRLKQCAAFALSNPQDMALATVGEIAQKADVQPSALVRFAQSMGYAGFTDLQRIFKNQLSERWPDYPTRLERLEAAQLDGAAALLDGVAQTAMTSLAHLRESMDPAALEDAARVLAEAETVYVVGARRSYPVAAYLGYALMRLGVRAQLIDGVGGMQGDIVRLAGPRDAVLAVTFTPYATETLAFAEKAAAAGAAVVALTDNVLSPIAPLARVRIEVSEAHLGGFRVNTATFCVAMALALAVGAARGDPAATAAAESRADEA